MRKNWPVFECTHPVIRRPRSDCEARCRDQSVPEFGGSHRSPDREPSVVDRGSANRILCTIGTRVSFVAATPRDRIGIDSLAAEFAGPGHKILVRLDDPTKSVSTH